MALFAAGETRQAHRNPLTRAVESDPVALNTDEPGEHRPSRRGLRDTPPICGPMGYLRYGDARGAT